MAEAKQSSKYENSWLKKESINRTENLHSHFISCCSYTSSIA